MTRRALREFHTAVIIIMLCGIMLALGYFCVNLKIDNEVLRARVFQAEQKAAASELEVKRLCADGVVL